jgi:quercetin dioxygenase-like cupin family protein
MARSPAPVEVVRGATLAQGTTTPGILRRRAFELPGVVFSESRIAPGVRSDWHHHARRTLCGYLVEGRLRFDFGPGGRRRVSVVAGDYFRIAPGVVHRDVNPDPRRTAFVVAALVGDGDVTVNTEGPDPPVGAGRAG